MAVLDQAVISDIELTPTHDGEAALVVELRYPNGACARVQIGGRDAQAVMQSAGVRAAVELIGRPWGVLCIQAVAGPRPLPG